jgi:hypothetical protein
LIPVVDEESGQASLKATSGVSHRAQGRWRLGDSHNVDNAPKDQPSAPTLVHPSLASSTDSAMSIVRRQATCKPAVATGLYPSRTQQQHGEPARSPFFCGDFFDFDLEIMLGNQLLRPRILAFTE